MTSFKLPQQLGQEVLNYLVTRPYADVYKLVAALQSLEILEEPKE